MKFSRNPDRDRPTQRPQRGWYALLCLGVAVLLWVGSPRSLAQPTPSPTASPSPSLLPSPSLGVPELEGLFPTDSDEVDRASIRLDGRRLFLIAARSSTATDAQRGEDPVDLRVDVIQDRLRRIAESDFDPRSLEVTAAIDRSSQLPVLYVRYAVDGAERNDQLLTVTTLDAEVHATEAETLAAEWAQIVETSLLEARQERQPTSLRRQGILAAAIVFLTAAASGLIALWQRHLAQKREILRAESHAKTEQLTSTTGEPGAHENRAVLLQQQMETRQRRGLNEIQWRLSQGAQVLLWGGGAFLILGLFPYTRWLQPVVLRWVQIPIEMLAVGYGTYLAIRFSGVLVDRFFLVLQDSTSLAPEASQRLVLRFSTFARFGKSILAVVLLVVGIIIALSVVNIQVGPLLAGAGIVGLAVSFASQSLIKDMINGFFILLEDQYGVGDVIIVDDVSGAVENMNLRITQLRNEEGRLITIPNSAITIVQNLSKEWARVDLRVDVAYSADIDQALQLIEQVAQTMSRDRPWRDLILEPPLLLGVDELDYSGATVRLWIKTQPLKQWEVAREYRRRLKVAFDQAGISFGIPQQSLLLHNEDEEESPLTARDGRSTPEKQRNAPTDTHRASSSPEVG